MSDETRRGPAEVASQVLAALQHLRDVWDVTYVPAAGPIVAAQGLAPGPGSPTPSPGAGAHSETAHQASTPLPVVGQHVREQAQSWSAATKLEYLRRRNLGDCQRCPLAKTRKNIVFGSGNPDARIMFVGEAPGAEEDRTGEPFVGRAGQRLDQWLAEVGLSRADVYIANVLKCRPPGNRDPRPEEVDRCAPFLQAQIRAIAPKVLVALGRHAGMLLSRREDLSLAAMRKASLHYEFSSPGESSVKRVPIIVTYHPAYVLRQERDSPPGAGTETIRAEQLALTDLRRAHALPEP